MATTYEIADPSAVGAKLTLHAIDAAKLVRQTQPVAPVKGASVSETVYSITGVTEATQGELKVRCVRRTDSNLVSVEMTSGVVRDTDADVPESLGSARVYVSVNWPEKVLCPAAAERALHMLQIVFRSFLPAIVAEGEPGTGTIEQIALGGTEIV